MMLLSDLNDDCLEHIFKFLPLDAQIGVKNLCMRFEHVTKSIWRRGSKKVTVAYEFKDKSGSQQLLEYMTTVADVVEELTCHLYVAQLRMLDSLTFPKVKTLDCCLWNDNPGTNDQDTLLIAKLFPALEKLKIFSSITGQNLWLLEKLTDLDLSCCEFLKTKYLARIFTTLKLRKFTLLYYGSNSSLDERIMVITRCVTLEKLKIDEDELRFIIDAVLCMPAMRKIVCFTRYCADDVLDKIADSVGSRMQTMIYQNIFWADDMYAVNLMKMPNLKKLILLDDIKEDFKEDVDLDVVADRLPNLRELTVVGVRLGDLCNFLQHCRELQILNVSRTFVNAEFLADLINAVEIQSKTRLVPLELRCHGTVIADNFSAEVPLPPLLKVSTKEDDIELLDDLKFFQCEWLPMGS